MNRLNIIYLITLSNILASYFGDKELTEILLKSKADVNLKNSIGQTALHIG
jgi:ankyrin repeat protein